VRPVLYAPSLLLLLLTLQRTAIFAINS